MFLALTYSSQSRTTCLIVSGSLHWLQRGCSSCFIHDMYVGEVSMTIDYRIDYSMISGMTDSCSGIDNFGTSRGH